MPFKPRTDGNPQETRILFGTLAPCLANIGVIASITPCSHASRCANVFVILMLACVSQRLSLFKRFRRGILIHCSCVLVRRTLAWPAAMPAFRHYFLGQRFIQLLL